MSVYIDDVVDSLRDNEKLTPENIQILLQHEAKRCLDIAGSSKYFTLKSISMNPETLKEMNYNLDYKMQDDFEPVVIEPEEVEEPEIEIEEPQDQIVETEETVEEEEEVLTGEGGFDV
jgi:hypothetical protein